MEKSNKQILFESSNGIVFERTDLSKRVAVCVRNKIGGVVHRTYRFNKTDIVLESPYISWENLNCCGGWSFDKSYLLTAVQEGKKLCAGITLYDENEAKVYLNSLDAESPHFCPPPTHNGDNTFFHIDVTRKGCIGDYIDMTAVRKTYLALDIDFLDFGIVQSYAERQMIHLLDGTASFDYANPNGSEQFVVTGLLLGYPIESTAALLLE